MFTTLWCRIAVVTVVMAMSVGSVAAHESTREHAQNMRLVAQAKADKQKESPQPTSDRTSAQLTIDLVDAETAVPRAGLVRITNLDTNKEVQLDEAIDRAMNWYSGNTLAI